MQYYCVIDTNVIVSALWKKDSVPAEVLQYVRNGAICPLLSDAIVAEYREVLSRPKFSERFSQQEAKDVLTMIEKNGSWLEPESLDYEVHHATDVVFYAVVMEKRKEEIAYLVTGNTKHFPNKIFVVTPLEMLQMLRLTAF